MNKPVTVVAAGCTEHGPHVPRGERGVPGDEAFEVGRQAADLFDHPSSHLSLHLAVAERALLDGVPQRKSRRRMLTVGGEFAVVGRKDLQGDGGVCGYDPAPGVLPLPLQLFRSAENADGRLHFGILQHVVGRRERGHVVQGEMYLQVAGAVVDPGESLAYLGQQRIRIHQTGDRDVGATAEITTRAASVDPSFRRTPAVRPSATRISSTLLRAVVASMRGEQILEMPSGRPCR